MKRETPRQKRARQSAQWRTALAEGRVVKIDAMTFKSYPTAELAKASGYHVIISVPLQFGEN